uniref:Uncharacterized protein n=1 Tax=Oryza punctata TaxID=4537 RepID=A0A0E0LS82_ORYPU
MAATHAQPSGVDARDEPNVAVAANRRNGAHAVLAAASALVGLPAEYAKVRAALLLLLLLLGCATVHLSMGGRRHRPRALLGAYALLVLGAVLVLVSTSYDDVPRSVRPAAAAAARGLDGLLFGGRFAPASDADD